MTSCENGFYTKTQEGVGWADGKLFLSFSSTVTSWKASVLFDSNIFTIRVTGGTNENCVHQTCSFSSATYNGQQAQGTNLSLAYSITYLSLTTPKITSITLNGQTLCSIKTTTGNRIKNWSKLIIEMKMKMKMSMNYEVL